MTVNYSALKVAFIKSSFYGKMEDDMLLFALKEFFKKMCVLHGVSRFNYSISPSGNNSFLISITSDPFAPDENNLENEICEIALDGNFTSFRIPYFACDFFTVNVPGAMEIGHALNLLCSDRVLFSRDSDSIFIGAVLLGCVIRGETTHFDHVCFESMRLCNDVAIKNDIAIGNGIVTANTDEQANHRIYGEKNIPALAVRCLLDMITLFTHVRVIS